MILLTDCLRPPYRDRTPWRALMGGDPAASSLTMGMTGSRLDLWFASLDVMPLADLTAVGALDDIERQRASRFVRPNDAAHFVKAHTVLRLLLAAYVRLPAKDLRFEQGTHGKPRLTARICAEPVAFNLSHSGSELLVGITRGGELGVDIEVAGRELDVSSLARNFFCPNEVAYVLSGDVSQPLHQRFLQVWTLKEAAIKAQGGGLDNSLSSFSVIHCGKTAGSAQLPSDPRSWQLFTLPRESGVYAALATDFHPEVRIHRLVDDVLGSAR